MTTELNWKRQPDKSFTATHRGLVYAVRPFGEQYQIHMPGERGELHLVVSRRCTDGRDRVQAWVEREAVLDAETLLDAEADALTLEELVQRLRYDGVLGAVSTWLADLRRDAHDRVLPQPREAVESFVRLVRGCSEESFAAHKANASSLVPVEIMLAMLHNRIRLMRRVQ